MASAARLEDLLREHQSAAGVPALYEKAHAGIVPLRDLPIFEGALPTKMFEVMAAGRALIRFLSSADARPVVAKTGLDPIVPAAAARK